MSICPVCYNITPPLLQEVDLNQDLVRAASRGDLKSVKNLVSELEKIRQLDQQAVVQARILAQGAGYDEVDAFLLSFSD